MAKDENQPAVVGIDLGGTNITAGLVDADNNVVERIKMDTEAVGGPDHVLQRLGQAVDKLIRSSKLKRADVLGVGLGVPGAVDHHKGVVLNAPNLRWKDLHLVEEIGKYLELPVTLDNDVNVGTWGEYQLGGGRGHRSVLGVFVGTGIGGGFVFDGELFTGAFSTAGEIGHITLDAFGPHGSRTLEQLASRTAIINRLVAMVSANHPSDLPELAGEKWPRIRSKVLAKAAAADDELTLKVLQDAAHAVGCAVAGVVTLLSLDCVVIGGGLTEALDERWLEWIRRSFDQAVFPEACRACAVVASELDDDAGLLGAALLARHRLGSIGG